MRMRIGIDKQMCKGPIRVLWCLLVCTVQLIMSKIRYFSYLYIVGTVEKFRN
ncbi:unnamed protein product [Gongylonema pulchrum]|uniref:Uncharacterized protein n=1 Tax=Gongylonema pulchrum TaxID=637853 RepID=A0A3P6SQP4_9BILA|nr:unnamed protein product [Gongylonema pulchrum]